MILFFVFLKIFSEKAKTRISSLVKAINNTEKKELKLRLDIAKFCRVRHCPICQWRRSLRWKAKAFKILPEIVENYPKHRWLFLTLTIKNCAIEELRETLKWMNQSWQRMVQRTKFPAIGWIRSTEVSRGKDASAHPHFHCLLLVPPIYFSGKRYINQKDWVKLWRSCLRINYDPILHIRPIKKGHQPMELVPEILKYCVKESDLIVDREWFLELTRQLHKMRNISTGGILKEHFKQLKKLEQKTKHETNEEPICFSWKYYEKEYKLID